MAGLKELAKKTLSDAGQYWGDRINESDFQNWPKWQQFVLGSNPLTGPALAMGEYHNASKIGDRTGQALAVASGVLDPIPAGMALKHVGKAGLGLAAGLADMYYDPPTQPTGALATIRGRRATQNERPATVEVNNPIVGVRG